jgi:hypothetical protein
MIPFRVFDRAQKQMWQIINYHPDPATGGNYLATREDDSEHDGDIKIIPASSIEGYKFIEFVEETDSMLD